MSNYSICYLDALGRTLSSKVRRFDDNRAATDFACIGLITNASVEVWRHDVLVARLHRSSPRSGPNAETSGGARIIPMRNLSGRAR